MCIISTEMSTKMKTWEGGEIYIYTYIRIHMQASKKVREIICRDTNKIITTSIEHNLKLTHPVSKLYLHKSTAIQVLSNG